MPPIRLPARDSLRFRFALSRFWLFMEIGLGPVLTNESWRGRLIEESRAAPVAMTGRLRCCYVFCVGSVQSVRSRASRDTRLLSRTARGVEVRRVGWLIDNYLGVLRERQEFGSGPRGETRRQSDAVDARRGKVRLGGSSWVARTVQCGGGVKWCARCSA